MMLTFQSPTCSSRCRCATTTMVATIIIAWIAVHITMIHAFIHHPVQRGMMNTAIHRQQQQWQPMTFVLRHQNHQNVMLSAKNSENNENNDDNDDEKEEYVNPYADPNYPDLEFVDYSDPEYMSDRSEYFADDDGEDDDWKTEQEIEKLREERRRKNDEYQYQVYYRDVLRNGAKFYGEWQIYETSTFRKQPTTSSSQDNNLPPQLIKRPVTLAVQSSAQKQSTVLNNPSTTADGDENVDIYDHEHIQHFEQIVMDPGIGEFLSQIKDDEDSSQSLLSTYWPEELRARDFRGHQGIMVCGK